MTKRVKYIWDDTLKEHCNRLPAVAGRASMVHYLIQAYNILDYIDLVESKPASYEELNVFHSDLYLDHLRNIGDIDEEYMPSNEDDEYGIGYDCPPVPYLYDLVSSIAGASISAARCLTDDQADVAINWCGGWHHAHRFGADGFCYVNDVVLAIEKLKEKYSKVLYIDLDVHHGDGVQDAYNLSKSVFTLSFHKYEPGFYPGTGGLNDIGTLTGKGYCCNFPLQGCYHNETLEYAFDGIFPLVFGEFAPEAIVVQCGADGLAHDPHGGCGLTESSFCKILKTVLTQRKPTLILGGGGYNHPNTARLWTSLTALTAGVALDPNIPEFDDWPEYGPDFTISVDPALAKDTNTKEYLDGCISTIRNNIFKFVSEKNNIEPKCKIRKTESSLGHNNNFSNISKGRMEINTLSAAFNNGRKLFCPLTSKESLIECKNVYEFTD